MAIRNISVKVTANIGQYTQAMARAATATSKFTAVTNSTRGFSSAASGMNRMSSSANKAAGGMLNFKRAVGGGLTRELGHTSAVAHRSNKIFNAMANSTGVLAKGMAALKVATMATLSAFAGFIFINTAIQAVKSFVDVVIGGFTDFNRAITETMAIIPDAGGQIEAAFTDASKSIAKVTKFDPAQIAEGFYFLSSAGYTAAQSLGTMEQVARFAQAGVMELAEAAEVAADTTAALGLADKFDPKGTEDAVKRVTDVMVNAAKEANATVEQFGEAFTNKFANMLNITNKSVEEGAAILSVFANQGIKGQIAGTRATMALRDLQRAALKVPAVFASMNIEVYDANGNMNNMADIIEDMEVSFSGMSDQQKKASLQMLGFQDRSVQAIQALLGGSNAMRRFEESANGAAGAVEEVSEKQMKSLENRLNVLVSNIKSVSVSIGQFIYNNVQKFVDYIAPSMSKIADAVRSVLPQLGMLAKPFAALAGAGIVTSIRVIATAITAVATVVEKFSSIFTVLIGLVGVRWVMASGIFTSAANSMHMSIVNNMRGSVAGMEAIQAYGREVRASGSRLNAAAYAAGTYRANVEKTGRTAMTSANGMSSAFSNFGVVMTGVMIGATTAMQVLSRNTENAKKVVDEFWESRDTESRSGLESGLLESQAEVDRVKAKLDATKAAFGNNNILFGGIKIAENLIPWLDNTVNQWEEELVYWVEINDENEKKLKKQNEKIFKAADMTGFSVDFVEKTVGEIGVDLTQEGDAGVQAMETLVGALQNTEDQMARSGVAAEDMSSMTTDEIDSMTKRAEDQLEDFAKAIEEAFGFEKVMEDAIASTELFYEALQEPADVFGKLKDDAEEGAKEWADAQAEGFNDGVDAQIDALEKRKDAIDDNYDKIEDKIKKREKKAAEAARDAQKDAIDDQIDALRDQRKEQEDFYKEPEIGLRALLDGLAASTAKSLKFSESLLKLREMGLDVSVIQMFRNMGEEALPLLDQLISEGKAKIEEFNNWALLTEAASPPILADEVIKSVEEKKALFDKQTLQSMRILQDVNWETLNLPEGITGAQILEQIIGMGPEGEALLDEMVLMLETGANGGVEKVKSLMEAVAWPSDFMNLVTTMDTTMQTVETLAARGAKAIQETINGSFQYVQSQAIATMADLQELFGGAPIVINGKSIDFMALEKAGGELAFNHIFGGTRDKNLSFGGLFGGGSSGGSSGGRSSGKNSSGTSNATTGPVIYPPPNTGAKYIPAGLKKGDYWWDLSQNRQRRAGYYAEGGFHSAQIARDDKIRIWNEPETGGEAYIPMGSSKRARSTAILKQVAHEFGYGLTKYANGGIRGPAGYAMVGASNYGTPNQPAPIVVPVARQETTNFNGDIVGVKMDDAIKYTEKKKRQKNLTRV